MKTVKIPDDVRPVWSCSINGKDYEYPAGATVTVPDEVAALIANNNASKPKHVTPVPTQEIKKPTAAGKVLKSVAKDGGYEYQEGEDAGSILPTVSSTDNGKVLGVVEGAWGKMAAPSGLPSVSGSDNGKVLKVSEGSWVAGAAPANNLYVTLTEGDDDTYTADKTITEIETAYAANTPVFLRDDTMCYRLISVDANQHEATSERIMINIGGGHVADIAFVYSDGAWTEDARILDFSSLVIEDGD